MDDQQGITGKILDGIKDRLLKKSDWMKWFGSFIILDILFMWNWAFFRAVEMKAMDALSFTLVIIILIILGLKSTGVKPTDG